MGKKIELPKYRKLISDKYIKQLYNMRASQREKLERSVPEQRQLVLLKFLRISSINQIVWSFMDVWIIERE